MHLLLPPFEISIGMCFTKLSQYSEKSVQIVWLLNLILAKVKIDYCWHLIKRKGFQFLNRNATSRNKRQLAIQDNPH